MIFAILRAQWMSMRSFRLGSRRRGAIFSILTALIWYGFWGMLALAAEAFTSDSDSATAIEIGLPVGFMLVFLYWQLAPLVSASLGASLDLKKLLVYPIPHERLFVVEVLLRLTTCGEMLLILGGAFIGLFRNPAFGGWAVAPRLIVSFAVFVLFNILLAAGLRNLLERLMSRKRLREVIIFLLVLAAATPRLILEKGDRLGALRRLFAGTPHLVWPWVSSAHIVLSRDVLPAYGILAAWLAAAYLFGRWQFERSLRYDAQAAAATELKSTERGEQGWVENLYRFPSRFLPDPLAAMVEKELRSLTRTPRFRLVFLMGCSFGLIVWIPIALRAQNRGDSVMQENFLTVVSVYALVLLGQVSYLNAFGFDRSAAQVYFSLPVPVSQALAGKNVAAALFILLEMVAVTAACLLLQLRIPANKILEAFLVTAVVALYLLATGNLTSVHYPRAMNPERVAHGGAASRLQALIFLFYPIALLPVVLAFVARYLLDSQVIFYLLLAFAALLGVVVYWIAMESAVSAAQRRREIILAELSHSEGPIVTE